MIGIGEAAALATALSWAGGSLFFAAATRRHTAPILNLFRILLATGLLAVMVVVVGGAWSLPPLQFVAIAVSGVLGLALGDAAYFRSLHILGPRRAMLLMALWPAMAALLMVPLLDERLGWIGVVGIAITIAGVVWVQSERDDGTETVGSPFRGALFGVLAAVGQALGYLFVKVGLGAAPAGAWLPELMGVQAQTGSAVAGEPVDALYGTFLRMAVAAVALLIPVLSRFRPDGWFTAMRDRVFLWQASSGVVLGTVVGVWLSLIAVANANTAVAGTIIATSPVLVIPMIWIVHRRTTSSRGWVGACIALTGVAILTFREVLAAGLASG